MHHFSKITQNWNLDNFVKILGKKLSKIVQDFPRKCRIVQNWNLDNGAASTCGGIATKSVTIGTVYGLGITVYDSENSKTIDDDFMVINSDKDFLLLGVPWIDRSKANIDFNTRLLSIPISQRKKIVIPITLHKKRTNNSSLDIDTIDLKKT